MAGTQEKRQFGNTARLITVLTLNLVLVAGLVIVGITAHSLGVLAAGADYLGDAGGVGVALLAIWLSHRPNGNPKASTYGALVNGSWLLLLTLFVIVEAIRRLSHGVPVVHGLPVLIMSGIAAVVMFVGALLLVNVDHDGADEGVKLNIRAVLIDTAGDGAAAAGVAISSAIIAITHGFYWLDPGVALIVAVVIGYNAIALLARVSKSLKA